jgi:cupin fold WbuC family metalloprotein
MRLSSPIRTLNPEVVVAEESVTGFTGNDVAALRAEAGNNPRKRIRWCAHRDVGDRLHEMLIVHTDETYVRPHKHLNKAESLHIVEGRADIVLFDEDGRVTRVVRAGDYASGLTFFFRISQPIYHMQLIRTKLLVFHEATTGPFSREETIFPSWAPEEADVAARQAFLDRVEVALQEFN